MSLGKKLMVAAGAVLALLLCALIVLPFFITGHVVRRVRTAVDSAVDARVAWGGVGLSLLRDFPNLTFGLDDLTVVGNEPFAGDTLASVGSFRLVLDLGSVLGALRGRSAVVIRSVRVDEPTFHLKVLEDGTPNWDVARPHPAAAEAPTGRARALDVELRRLEVSDASIVFDDDRTGLFGSLVGLDHSLSGDFSRDRFVVHTRTTSDSATIRFAGVPYLDGVMLGFDADVEADMGEKRFTFRDNELRLNGLTLRFSGDAGRAGEDVSLDVRFDAPDTDFAQVLSLVPTIWAHDFAALRTSGTVSVAGRVQGAWGETAFPAFGLQVRVDDGMFHYPDLPGSARDIAVDLSIDNPGSDPDNTVVRLRRFHARLGDQPIDAAFTLRTPISDPDVDLSVKGTLDLADVARTVKLGNVEELTGVVAADAALHARLSDVDGARYDRVTARGSATVRDLTLRSADLPQSVAVEEARLELSPRRADLRSFRARIGGSDVRATGWLDNLLGFALRDEALHGSATLESRRFVLDEWRSDDPELEVIPVPPMLDLTLDATVDRLTFGRLELADARGRVRVADRRVTLEDFGGRTLGGEVGVSGYYETADPSKPTFGVDLTLDSLDISNAAASILTLRTLAPVAPYASGAFSAKLDLSGALGHDMTPLFDALGGKGSLLTSSIVLQGFPPLEKLADVLKVPQLGNPTLDALRSSIEIRDGRLNVRPFHVGVGSFGMTVAGSNGVDQSLDYTLALALPRSALGTGAQNVIQSLVSRAGKAGVDLQAADSIRVDVGVGGTVTAPAIRTDFAGAVASTGKGVEQAAGRAVRERVVEAEGQVDSAKLEARRRAQAAADSMVAEAQARADQVRAEAAKLAEEVRAEGDRRADQVLAEAKTQVAKVAAKPVADRIRKEANTRADGIVKEADARAEAIVAEARKRADALLAGVG